MTLPMQLRLTRACSRLLAPSQTPVAEVVIEIMANRGSTNRQIYRYILHPERFIRFFEDSRHEKKDSDCERSGPSAGPPGLNATVQPDWRCICACTVSSTSAAHVVPRSNSQSPSVRPTSAHACVRNGQILRTCTSAVRIQRPHTMTKRSRGPYASASARVLRKHLCFTYGLGTCMSLPV